MGHRRRRIAWILLPMTMYACTAQAAPPPTGGIQSSLPANEVVNFKGKLKDMRRGMVIVEKDDGTEVMVAPPDSIASFQFVGKADSSFLRPGFLVRLTGTFNAAGLPTEPIEKITLFAPVDLRSIRGRAKQQFTPGIHSEAKHGNKQPMMAGKMTIVGHLVGWVPGGMMTLRAGKVPVRIPVSPAAKIEIRYNNLSLARPGDPISVAGFFQPPNETQIKADRITVTADRVFGNGQPAADEKGKRRKRDDAKQGDAESDSAAAKGDSDSE